jgi:hypothetical protein
MKFEDLLDEVDATVFSSDYLFIKHNLDNFKEHLERWQKECHSIEERMQELINMSKNQID